MRCTDMTWDRCAIVVSFTEVPGCTLASRRCCLHRNPTAPAEPRESSATFHPMHPTADARVILRHADRYDPELIRRIVADGLEELSLTPFGRTLVKPNLVIAGPRFEPAWTRVEFAEGVLRALQDRDSGRVTELAVGERCAITIPTRFVYQESGYDAMLERLDVK